MSPSRQHMGESLPSLKHDSLLFSIVYSVGLQVAAENPSPLNSLKVHLEIQFRDGFKFSNLYYLLSRPNLWAAAEC